MMDKKELERKLESHARWLYNKKGERLVLKDVDLSCANLEHADLRYAILVNVNLQIANLESANLEGADLRFAILEGAYLGGVNLKGADLRDAVLPFSINDNTKF